MLDQLDLAQPLLQEAFACRSCVTYKDGVRKPDLVWALFQNIQDTHYDFGLVLRQMYTERHFRKALKDYGCHLHAPAELIDFKIQDGPYKVAAKVMDHETKEHFTVECKYMIGADGGRSAVRRIADIDFVGQAGEDKWVRIDGIVETDMPMARSYGAIESGSQNVLWAPLDHGATRIGYAFTREREAKYGEFTEEAAVAEAVEMMKPFSLKFKQVDWYTIYGVGQRVAKEFFSQGCILLAGDACHTHSSAAAQGLNTGLGDAVNLGWKLALTIKGLAHPDLLSTYNAERQPVVQQLINYDKELSVLMSGRLPPSYTGPKDADPNDVVGKIMQEVTQFNLGLGITYPSNKLNVTSDSSGICAIRPGHRCPDVKLRMPGTNETIRLQRVTLNFAKFWVLVFAGEPHHTLSALTNLKTFVSKLDLENLPIDFVTIPAITGNSPMEALGIEPFGNAYYDSEHLAYNRFGIDVTHGALVIVRPDGWVGSVVALTKPEELKTYFQSILLGI